VHLDGDLEPIRKKESPDPYSQLPHHIIPLGEDLPSFKDKIITESNFFVNIFSLKQF